MTLVPNEPLNRLPSTASPMLCYARLLLLALAVGGTVAAPNSCRRTSPQEAVALLEPLLVATSIGQPERTTRDDRGRKGDPVHVIELAFQSDQSVSDLRDYYNNLLLDDNAYAQTLNISTPGASQIEYASPTGNIYITVSLQQPSQGQPHKPPAVSTQVSIVISYLKQRL